MDTSLSLALPNSTQFAIENSTITQGPTTLPGFPGVLDVGNCSDFVIKGNTFNFAAMA